MIRRATVVALLALAACRKAPAPPPVSQEVLADSADQFIVGFTTTQEDNGARISLVRGDSAWFYQVNQTYDIRGLTVSFSDSTGRTISTIQAKRGIYRIGDQSLDARDSVVATIADGRVLRTAHLVWDKMSNEISSDTAFTLTSPNPPPLVRGRSFWSTPDFRTVHINEAGGRLTRPDGSTTRAPAPRPATGRGRGAPPARGNTPR